VSEAGVPGYEAVQWFGIAVPSGTPPEVIQRLNSELKAILALPDVRARFGELGFDVVGNSPEEFGQFLRSENAKWKKIAETAGTRLD
jgi:tripartite-type tricarboxylate transporter receptor subunit TctC